MKRLTPAAVAFAMNISAACAQNQDTTLVDTTLITNGDTIKTVNASKPKFILAFDSRQSFVAGKLTKMNGLKIGMELQDRYRFGLGFYNLDETVEFQEPFNNSKDTVNVINVGFKYNTLYAEYVFYQDYRWEISLPLSIGRGTGTVNFKIKELNSNNILYDSTKVLPKTPILTINAVAHYKVFNWVGIGVGLGYRQMVTGNKDIRRAFNSPFYVIKLKIFLDGLYKSIFKHDEVIKEREEYKKTREQKRKSGT